VTNERDNAGFAIERSPTLTGFERVGYVAAQTTGAPRWTYSFVDRQPLPGINYYRIRQYDTNGDNDLSRTIGVVYSLTDWLMWGENPSAGPLALRAGSVIEEVLAYDAQGRLVQALSPASPEAEVGAGSWMPGVYVLRVRLASGTAQTVRWLKW
jgi:hypothetical protein